jgi:hypothetical protein
VYEVPDGFRLRYQGYLASNIFAFFQFGFLSVSCLPGFKTLEGTFLMKQRIILENSKKWGQ